MSLAREAQAIHRQTGSLDDWFRAKGWSALAFQKECWQAYVEGHSGLLHAPTGVGKTLAIWGGPLMEHAGGDGSLTARPLRIVWLTPLRALAGDTVRSLQEPLGDLGFAWAVEKRTGDTSSAVKLRQRQSLPTALVTTPESMSLLLSYPPIAGQLKSIELVVVDEWHELLGSKRGVQTELVLARLRRLSPNLRLWGLSATIPDADRALSVLLGRADHGGRLIRAPEKKTIISVLKPPTIDRFPWSGHMGLRLADQVIAQLQQAGSSLIFTNTRAQAELWFQELMTRRPDWLGRIALHHGSLSRIIREQVESGLKEGRFLAVVCTSSLDLGVDFPPVEQVLQVGSPKGVGRLLQRAGRSGHQPGVASRIWCVPAHALEIVEFAAARDAIVRGELEGRPELNRPLDVLVQHMITLGLGDGFQADALYAEVCGTWAYRDLERQEWQWALDFVTRGGPALKAYPHYAKLTRRGSRYVVSSDRIARLHRLSIGTITGDESMHVKYANGRKLGHIEESFVNRLRPGDVFTFAGRKLKLLRVREMTAYVKAAGAEPGVVPRWMGGRMPLSTELAAAVQRLLAGPPGSGRDADLRFVDPILALQRKWSVIPAPGQLLIEQARLREGYHTFCYPFAGRLVHEGLANLVAYRIAQRVPCTIGVMVNDYGFELHSTRAVDFDPLTWRGVLSTERLMEDIVSCVNATEMARRHFRDIARVAGLVNSGYPGRRKLLRHLQASSELFFDVFKKYDPQNLLMIQARREVLEGALQYARLQKTLDRVAEREVILRQIPRLSPLAFPLWADRIRSQVSSEQATERIARMLGQLEKAAG